MITIDKSFYNEIDCSEKSIRIISKDSNDYINEMKDNPDSKKEESKVVIRNNRWGKKQNSK